MSQAVRFRDMWSVPGSSVLALAVAVAAACVPSVSHSAADEVLYGVTYDGKLITIDLATGAGTLVGSSTLSGCEAMEEANDSTLAVIDGANTFWLVQAFERRDHRWCTPYTPFPPTLQQRQLACACGRRSLRGGPEG